MSIFRGMEPEDEKALRAEMKKRKFAVYLGTVPDDPEVPGSMLESFKIWDQEFPEKEIVPILTGGGRNAHEKALKLSCLGSFKTFLTEDEAKKFVAGLKKPKAVAPKPAASTPAAASAK